MGSHRILKHKHHQDFPIDSCACHIFYEHWVQMQLVISKTPLGPEDLSSWRGGWGLDWIGQISDFDSHFEENKHEWNLQMVSWLPRSFSQLLFARTSKSPDLLAKDDRRLCWTGAGRGWRIWKRSINMKQLLIDFFQRDFLFEHV